MNEDNDMDSRDFPSGTSHEQVTKSKPYALIVGLAIALILIIVGIFILANRKENSVGLVDTSKSYTKNEVAQHKSRSDCWTYMNGKVYDVTSYISRHQGGNNILSACGGDLQPYFSGQQAGQEGESNQHSSRAESDLSDLQIGTLTQ